MDFSENEFILKNESIHIPDSDIQIITTCPITGTTINKDDSIAIGCKVGSSRDDNYVISCKDLSNIMQQVNVIFIGGKTIIFEIDSNEYVVKLKHEINHLLDNNNLYSYKIDLIINDQKFNNVCMRINEIQGSVTCIILESKNRFYWIPSNFIFPIDYDKSQYCKYGKFIFAKSVSHDTKIITIAFTRHTQIQIQIRLNEPVVNLKKWLLKISNYRYKFELIINGKMVINTIGIKIHEINEPIIYYYIPNISTITDYNLECKCSSLRHQTPIGVIDFLRCGTICDDGCGVIIPNNINITKLSENIPDDFLITDVEWIIFQERIKYHLEKYNKYKKLDYETKIEKFDQASYYIDDILEPESDDDVVIRDMAHDDFYGCSNCGNSYTYQRLLEEKNEKMKEQLTKMKQIYQETRESLEYLYYDKLDFDNCF
jgi:hypothetical protein